jgi:hypothetical protein
MPPPRASRLPATPPPRCRRHAVYKRLPFCRATLPDADVVAAARRLPFCRDRLAILRHFFHLRHYFFTFDADCH